jgi:hypothetical protein
MGVRCSASSSSLAATSHREPTVQEMEEQEARDLANDKKAVDHELGRYEEEVLVLLCLPDA